MSNPTNNPEVTNGPLLTEEEIAFLMARPASGCPKARPATEAEKAKRRAQAAQRKEEQRPLSSLTFLYNGYRVR